MATDQDGYSGGSAGVLFEIMGSPRISVAPVPWEVGTLQFGLSFPTDYRAFVDRYGSVGFSGELSIWSPALPSGFAGFLEGAREAASQLAEELLLDDEFELPREVGCDVGDLLAWGNNSKGDHLFWNTRSGTPDEWPVIIWYQEIAQFDDIGGGACQFLSALISGEYELEGELIPRESSDIAWWHQGDWAGNIWPWH